MGGGTGGGVTGGGMGGTGGSGVSGGGKGLGGAGSGGTTGPCITPGTGPGPGSDGSGASNSPRRCTRASPAGLARHARRTQPHRKTSVVRPCSGTVTLRSSVPCELRAVIW